MRLYTYFRSSAAYRVRIALALKGLDYDAVPVHLVRGGGEHRQPAYLQLNPAGLVPALEDGGEVSGFLCEPTGLAGAQDISAYGGWRAWRARS